MKLRNIIKRQMRYWQELVKNTSLKNAMNQALMDIRKDGIKKQHDVRQRIIQQNKQSDQKIIRIHRLMNMLNPPIEIFYPNGTVKLRFSDGKVLKIKGKDKKD